MSQILNPARYYSELNFLYSSVCIHLSGLILQGLPMKVESESEVAQSCLTLSDPMDCSLPGSSIHGIFQASVLEWGASGS